MLQDHKIRRDETLASWGACVECDRQIWQICGKEHQNKTREKSKYGQPHRYLHGADVRGLPLTLSALKPKTDTFANSVDQDETAQHEPSLLDLHCLPFCSWFTTVTRLAAVDVSKYRDGSVYFRNSGLKGLTLRGLDTSLQGRQRQWLPVCFHEGANHFLLG